MTDTNLTQRNNADWLDGPDWGDEKCHEFLADTRGNCKLCLRRRDHPIHDFLAAGETVTPRF